MKIKTTISVAVLSTSIVLMAAAAGVFYYFSVNQMKKEVFNQLKTATISRADHIITFLDAMKGRMVDFSSDGYIKNCLSALGGNEQINCAAGDLTAHLIQNKLPAVEGLAEVFTVNLEGRIVASTQKKRIGVDATGDPSYSYGKKGPFIKDLYFSKTMGQNLLTVSAPVIRENELVGVVGGKIRPQKLYEILLHRSGLGETGEIYLVNKDGYMISPSSRFGESVILKQRVDTVNVPRHLVGRDFTMGGGEGVEKTPQIFKNYRGVSVLGTHAAIPEMRWGLLAEVEVKEALGSLYALSWIFLIIGLASICVIYAVAVWLGRRISRPVERLRLGTEIVMQGNLAHRVGIETSDEIGYLSRSFDQMTEKLNNTLKDMEAGKERLVENESKIRAIVDSAIDGIIVIDEQGMIDSFNPAAERIFGYKAQEVIGRSLTMLMPEPYRSEHDGYIRRYLETGRKKIVGVGGREVVGKRKDATVFPLEISVNEMRAGDRRMFSGVVRDITQRRKAQEDLRKLSRAVEQSPASVCITDPQGVIEYVNPKFMEVTGYALDELIGKKPSILKSGYTSQKQYKELWDTITAGREWRGEFYNRKKNGELFWEDGVITPIKADDGTVTHFIAVKEDITVRKEYEQRLVHQANFDDLTELPNRLLAFDRLSQTLARARRERKTMAVMSVNINHFKRINDTLGHAVGDKLLVEASRRLTRSVRESDTVARFSNDEFLVILSDISVVTHPAVVARKVINAFSDPFLFSGHEVFVTVGIGITLYPSDGNNSDVLLRNADAALYRAKEEGRSSFVFFTPEMNELAVKQITMESHLRRAVEKDELFLRYQPLVHVESGQIVGVEALLRWNSPDLGLLTPDSFIPLAEETGIIVPIGEWVLQTACAKMKKWQAQGGAPLRIAVNVSSRQFTAGNLAEVVSRAINESGLSPRYLELEITERLLMEDAPQTFITLSALKKMGVQLSIDDFGTRYSVFSYLKKFPFNTLKIDKMFTGGLTIDPADAALTEAIILTAHSLGLKVIAEGVETKEQLEFLRSHECDWAQGYYFSKPLSPEEFQKFLHHGQSFYTS